jgi:hypothetical protein
MHVVSNEMSIPLVIYEMHTFCGCRLAVEQFVIQQHSVTKDKLLYIFLIVNLKIHYRSMTTPWTISYKMDSNDLNFWQRLNQALLLACSFVSHGNNSLLLLQLHE